MDSNTQDFPECRCEENQRNQKGMLEYIKNAHPEIIDELNETKALSDELGDKILAAAKDT